MTAVLLATLVALLALLAAIGLHLLALHFAASFFYDDDDGEASPPPLVPRRWSAPVEWPDTVPLERDSEVPA